MDKYTCLICGKEFQRTPYHKRVRGGAKFCSKKCMNISKIGKKSWNYVGFKKTKRGYIYKRCMKDHPNISKDGYIMEHRLVVEENIGRYVKKGEQIHHVNEKKDDNRIENLMLFPSAKRHTEFHKFLDNLCIYLLGIVEKKPLFNFEGIICFTNVFDDYKEII